MFCAKNRNIIFCAKNASISFFHKAIGHCTKGNWINVVLEPMNPPLVVCLKIFGTGFLLEADNVMGILHLPDDEYNMRWWFV